MGKGQGIKEFTELIIVEAVTIFRPEGGGEDLWLSDIAKCQGYW